MEPKQVIVMRRDVGMRRVKEIAQASARVLPSALNLRIIPKLNFALDSRWLRGWHEQTLSRLVQ
jgi:peptidyl-tRNA hydrolase